MDYSRRILFQLIMTVNGLQFCLIMDRINNRIIHSIINVCVNFVSGTIITNHSKSENISDSEILWQRNFRLDELYFRWLEKSVIKTGKTVLIAWILSVKL